MDGPKRKNLRLSHYDYSESGYYFITICSHHMKCIFGNISDSNMYLTEVGNIIEQSWKQSSKLRQNISLHEFVIMPNHFHAIVEIKELLSNSSLLTDNRKTKLGDIVKGFKSSVTGSARRLHGLDRMIIWQRGYHEHVIRNEESLMKIKEYVINNPLKWELDRYYC